ncbi:MAG: branched-chain amino acid ABC transporter permease [Burkholderiaceae bacterium]|jgi:branched-chain amino acid transport system permease protein|nr:branched-chain amino acid ABC transporter permease [Burkholderiaceae bacterium]
MNRLRTLAVALSLLAFALVPIYAWATGDVYALTLFGRILVFVLAATGLNLALGYGGMVSFGHALYIGLGAYSVAILTLMGLHSGWLHLITAVAVSGLVAIPVGWVALRTQGIAFIMITLAFAQLFFYIFISLKNFGGDDGVSLSQVSNFGPLTGNIYALYLSLLVTALIVLGVVMRLVRSPFGLVLRATKVSERRVNAVGLNSLPYRLAAYVFSAQVCALAGFFLANLTGFVSPDYLKWSISGELIVMVLLGGLGKVFGPLVGATALLLIEEFLKALTEHWPLILGPLIVLMVIFLRRGLWSLLEGREKS